MTLLEVFVQGLGSGIGWMSGQALYDMYLKDSIERFHTKIKKSNGKQIVEEIINGSEEK